MKFEIFLTIIFINGSLSEKNDSQLEHDQQNLDDITKNRGSSKKDSKDDEQSQFDLEQFLQEIDDYECQLDKSKTGYDEKFNQLCPKNLEQAALKDIGNFREDGNNFWQYLENKIYKPLAFDVQKQGSVSEMLKQLVLMSDNHSALAGKKQSTDFADFREKVIDHFKILESHIGEEDPQKTSDLMVQILKDFHIHWNTLRLDKKTDKVKTETKNLMRRILQTYQIKEKVLFEMAKTVVDKIKLAYGNFVRAHLSHEMLKANGPKLIAQAIISRFEQASQQLHSEDYRITKYLEEIAYFLHLQETFHMVAYKTGYSVSRCTETFKEQVTDEIEKIFMRFKNDKSISDSHFIAIKDFTVILLLKFKHIHYKIFIFEGISQAMAYPFSDLNEDKKTTTKIYHELFDNLVMIPKKCVDMFLLQNCTYYQTNKILKYISKKYYLRLRTGGFSVYQFMKGTLKNMFKEANHMVWGNFTLYKNYFYQNLFAVKQNFAQQFLLQRSTELTELETELSKFLDEYENKNHNVPNLNFELIEQINQKLYNHFLDLKAQFQESEPIANKSNVTQRILDQMRQFFDKFKNDNVKKINDNFMRLLKGLDDICVQWEDRTSQAPIRTVQISELPLTATNLYPQVFHTINGLTNNSLKKNEKGFLPSPEKVKEEAKQNHNENLEKLKKIEKDKMSEQQYQEKIKSTIAEMVRKDPDSVVDQLYEKYRNQLDVETVQRVQEQIHKEEIGEIPVINPKDKQEIFMNGIRIPNANTSDNMTPLLPGQFMGQKHSISKYRPKTFSTENNSKFEGEPVGEGGIGFL